MPCSLLMTVPFLPLFPIVSNHTDSIYRPLKMIQTFIALLTEQNTTEMKYWRSKADIFYLKVLFFSNVAAGTHCRLLVWSL